jgi:hypothetical protein
MATIACFDVQQGKQFAHIAKLLWELVIGIYCELARFAMP